MAGLPLFPPTLAPVPVICPHSSSRLPALFSLPCSSQAFLDFDIFAAIIQRNEIIRVAVAVVVAESFSLSTSRTTKNQQRTMNTETEHSPARHRRYPCLPSSTTLAFEITSTIVAGRLSDVEPSKRQETTKKQRINQPHRTKTGNPQLSFLVDSCPNQQLNTQNLYAQTTAVALPVLFCTHRHAVPLGSGDAGLVEKRKKKRNDLQKQPAEPRFPRPAGW